MGGLEVALIAICASLLSVLTTVMLFVFGFRDRLTRVEEAVKAINNTLVNLNTTIASHPVCELHSALNTQVALSDERIQQLEKSLDFINRGGS